MPTLILPKTLAKKLRAAAIKTVSAERASRPDTGGSTRSLTANAPAERKQLVRIGMGMRLKSLWLANPAFGGQHANAAEKAWLQKNAAAYASVFGQGGSLLAEEYSSELIELLRNRAVLLEMGARAQSIEGKLNIGKLNGGAVVHMVDESEAPAASDLATGSVILEAKKAMGLLDASNDLLRRKSIDAAGLLADDMMQAMALKADEQGLLGSGKAGNCTGLFKQLAAGQKVAGVAITSANVGNVATFIDSLVQKVKASKIPFEGNSPGWIMSSKMESALMSLRDNAGWVYRASLEQGKLAGHPVYVTETVGDSRLAFGLAAQLYFGVEGDMLVSFAEPLFKQDVTTIRGIYKFDWKLRHDTAFSYSDNVTYA
jgi:HK97 family phage major capsid protein